MRSPKVLVVGSSVLDTVSRVNSFPAPGESVRASGTQQFPGGKGFNQAVAAKRLGADVVFVTPLGQDSSADTIRATYSAEGLDPSHIVEVDDEVTGFAFILLDAAGQNQIVINLGANSRFTPETALRAAHNHPHDVLLLQGEIPIESSLAAASVSQGHVIFNPAPALEVPEEMFEHVDFLTPNESEASHLTSVQVVDIESAARAATILISKGVRNVVITLGSAGAYFHSAEQSGFVTAPKVEVIDTVGAGDCFNGAFAVAIASGVSLSTAVEFAVHCASISVTKLGAQSGSPRSEELPVEVKKLLRNQRSV